MQSASSLTAKRRGYDKSENTFSKLRIVRPTISFPNRPHRLVHRHKVQALLRLNELPVFDASDGNPAKIGHRIGSFESQTVAEVLASDGATHIGLVTFGQRVLDSDFDVWKGFLMKGQKVRALSDLPGICQTGK